MGTIITLTTDFGLTDSYVAAMKGVILSINQEAKLVDICHTIKPQNIPQAAFVLSTAYQFFPEKTIHMVVVDPGVGTERRAIIVATPTAYFVAPDNGVLSCVIQQYSTEPVADNINQRQIKQGLGLEAVAITKPQFWRSPVSPTFHGRDIFAPVAAHLSLGTPLTDFGETMNMLTVLPLSRPHQELGGLLVGHVLNIDSFGNLITNIKSDCLPPAQQTVTVEVSNRIISGLSNTYAEGEELLALIGSSGYLEVSLKGGNACAFLNVKLGDEVRVKQQY
ncbi:S-adenosyl-l-methionine hydroxide adenosyltransferase family protein [Chloroflexota bacterium]